MPVLRLIQNVNIVHPASGQVTWCSDVALRDGRIDEIRPKAPGLVRDALDGSDLFLVPGMIDCHVHLYLNGGAHPLADFLNATAEQRSATARANAMVALEAGVTTVRDCGSPVDLIFPLRRDIESGVVPGPRIVACGAPLTRPSGHCHFWSEEVSTVQQVRATVERQLRMGAAFLKIIASGGGLTPGTSPSEADFALPLMREAVNTAHANGMPVAAHCHATESIVRALDAGVDTIEHASFTDPDGVCRFDAEIAHRILAHGVAVSPTVTAGKRIAQRLRARKTSDSFADQSAIQRLEARSHNTELFLRMGIKLIGGTDCGVTNTPFHSLVDEVAAYRQCGMGAAEAIRTVTCDSAGVLGLPLLGDVAPGYHADLVIVERNPLEDVTALRHPLIVIKGGELVSDRRMASVSLP